MRPARRAHLATESCRPHPSSTGASTGTAQVSMESISLQPDERSALDSETVTEAGGARRRSMTPSKIAPLLLILVQAAACTNHNEDPDGAAVLLAKVKSEGY